MSDVRDVIAQASRKSHRVAYEHEWTKPELDRYHGDAADAILAALHEAGYEVVKRSSVEPSQILTDAFGEPDAIEEVAPNTFKYTWPHESED